MDDIFKKGQKTTIIAALITIFFALAKAIAGFFSGSLVLMSDAIHSGADSFSTFAAWLGLKIAQKKPTEKFPYGFYKAENIAAFFISLLILFAGYSIIKGSLGKFISGYQLNIPLIAISVTILDALVMFFLGSYEKRIGEKINSQSLIADGQESKMHIFSSSIVLIGLFSTWLGFSYLEGIMAILISLFIFKIGIESAKDSIFSLMDVSPSSEIEDKIKIILENISGLKNFEDLKLRKSGPFIFGEVRAKIRKTMNVKRAYEISNKIEREIKKKVKRLDSFTISFEPFETKKQKICLPIDENQGLNSKISSHFGRAPRFMFIEIDNKEIQTYYLKKNPYSQKEIRAGLEASKFVMKEKIDSIITKEMGPISLHTLRDNIVDVYIYKKEEGIVKEIIEEFSEGKLKLLGEPTKKKT